ncbi:MAG: hypothetical protein H0W73_12195 [Bacteroidetes bacterium]|nr:hypothetical protein [Bacteroidota bacterium]
MTIQQFFSFTPSLQEQYLFMYGELIAEIEEEHFYSSLFLISDFYVEVFLCKHSSQILTIMRQEDPEIYLLYLDKLQVNISSLVNK